MVQQDATQDATAPLDDLSVNREDERSETVGVGDDRDRIADDRDERAEAHDEASQIRDDRAQARDDRAEVREQAGAGVDTGAAADRAGASRDRRGSASDRTQAADDREAAASDRHLSAQERTVSSIDELTGAYRRDAGTLELERELNRVRRTQQPLVLAFVDVDALKEKNDSFGHTAGDRLLRHAVESIRANLRSYDLIVRFGGDEFVCALIDVTVRQSAERFDAVNAELARDDEGSITVGLAEMRPGDTLADLLKRADLALYERRGHRSSGR